MKLYKIEAVTKVESDFKIDQYMILPAIRCAFYPDGSVEKLLLGLIP